MKSSRSIPAFTLVELLVVVGIVTLMSGLLGLALREGDPGRSLEAAQATFGSLIAVARNQAALSQNRAQLIIEADPATNHFLRGVHVGVESAPNSGVWWITEHGAVLPRGVYVVPGTASVTGVTYVLRGATPSTWPDERHSSLAELPADSVTREPDYPSGKYLGMIAPLTATGQAGAGGGDKFVLAVGRQTPGGVVFEYPDQVRGIALSSYGVATLLNDASGFDF